MLDHVDFTVSRGEFVAVIGPNGSGKSTLIKSLVGLADQLAGSSELFGLPGHHLHQPWRIGYVPQRQVTGSALPVTVREVVSSGRVARMRWFSPLRRSDRLSVDQAMERVGVEPLAKYRLERLSGGQQRRVMVARALASDAELLLLDEPTAGVDVEAQALLADVLAQLAATGTTVVLVTHDVGPFESDLTRVVWVNRGRFEYDGPLTNTILAAAAEPFHHHDDDAHRRPERQPFTPHLDSAS